MKEVELLTLDGLGSFFGRHKAFVPEPGQKCLNCETELKGRYCFSCGQDASNHHRHILHMIVDSVESLFHLDGRLWRTLPPLFFRPGTLARDYMTGRLARHVPPFRTFLVALLIFIFVSEGLTHHLAKEIEHKTDEYAQALHNPAAVKTHGEALLKKAARDYAEATATLQKKQSTDLKAAKTEADRQAIEANYAKRQGAAKAEYDAIAADPIKAAIEDLELKSRGMAVLDDEEEAVTALGHEASGEGSLQAKINKALKNPEALMLTMFGWGHRLAVLLLPLMTLVLGMLYFYRRQFFLFDHFLVACNLMSFIFFTNALVLALPNNLMSFGFLVLTIWTPINIFMTLRGAYGSGIFGAIIKTLLLWLTTTVSFAVLVTSIFLVSVNGF
ncbi:MAG: DUF3667 domain-containing protein [Asticcacaulis sp.]|uniref:DUF3667 domain-containing protein n=1 Tax=Asticcacaulis sp. TaxID=1872648 RepID=UPI0039E69464